MEMQATEAPTEAPTVQVQSTRMHHDRVNTKQSNPYMKIYLAHCGLKYERIVENITLHCVRRLSVCLSVRL